MNNVSEKFILQSVTFYLTYMWCSYGIGGIWLIFVLTIELDEMAGGVRNYGSISSTLGTANSDEPRGSTASLSEGFNISQILSSR